MNLLLVEDDLNLGKALVKVLADEYQPTWLRTLAGARQHLDSAEFDIVLLDLGLPDGDGRDWLQCLRQRSRPVPVMILSARDELEDRVQALDLGADDYLVKPFELEELKARIRALIRRQAGSAQPVVSVGNLSYSSLSRRFALNEQTLTLTPMEQRILAMLLNAGTAPVSRDRLMHALGTERSSNTLEVHIHSLRKQLGRDRIATVRGFGYRLSEP